MPDLSNASTIVWAPAQSAVSIEYSLDLMCRIRDHVIVGFHRLAKRGIECGGVLYGQRKGRRITIEAVREIRCEYRSGPSFILSESDCKALASQLAEPDPELSGLSPVGLYISHTKDDISVTERDLVIYDDFFPDPWQILLILRPGRQGAVRAGFFVREALGGMQTDRSYEEFELDPPSDPAESAALIAAARMAPAIEAPTQPRPRNRQASQDLRQPADVPAPAAATAAVIRASTSPAPNHSLETEPPRFGTLPQSTPRLRLSLPAGLLQQANSQQRHWIWLGAWVLLVITIASAVYWLLSLRNPDPILLRVSEQSGDLRIEWDRASSSIQHASSGTLEIRDGARTRTIRLSSDQLALGSYLFPAGASDVAIRLSVSAFLRPAIEESAHFVGEALTGSGPRGAAEVREQRDRLLLENRRLKNEIRRLEERIRVLDDSKAGARAKARNGKNKQQQK
jgi:hypothetical protein